MAQLGKYDLHEELGRGGFGTVYRATDAALQREVALKVLHPQLTTDPDFLEKFRNEAKIVAALDSPFIVTIHDLGEADGRVFIAMKYMAGGSLRQKIDKEGCLSFDQILAVMRQICAGLNAAHKKKLVHRDIKPANILFDSEGNAVISDFGLAKAIENSGMTAVSSVAGAGTPAYKAPELWEGKPPANSATDIYSLGCVLYEMITGKALFDGDSTEQILAQHLIKGPQIPKYFPQGVPDGFGDLLRQTLAKGQKDRFQSASMLINALETLGHTAISVSQSGKEVSIEENMQTTSSDQLKTIFSAEALGQGEHALESNLGPETGKPARSHLIPEFQTSWPEGLQKSDKNDDFIDDIAAPEPDQEKKKNLTISLAVTSLVVLLVIATLVIRNALNARQQANLEKIFQSTQTADAMVAFNAERTAEAQTKAMLLEASPSPTFYDEAAETKQRFARESDANFPEDAVYVFFMSDMAAQAPQVVSKEDEIIIICVWSTLSMEQMQEHIDNVIFDIKVDGQPVDMDVIGEISEFYIEDGDITLYDVAFFHFLGKLAPGLHKIETNISWQKPIFDGWNHFGPGTQYPNLTGLYEIMVK